MHTGALHQPTAVQRTACFCLLRFTHVTHFARALTAGISCHGNLRSYDGYSPCFFSPLLPLPVLFFFYHSSLSPPSLPPSLCSICYRSVNGPLKNLHLPLFKAQPIAGSASSLLARLSLAVYIAPFYDAAGEARSPSLSEPERRCSAAHLKAS